MFEIGQVVMHPSSGICKIESITTKSITKNEKKDYYVLKPIYSNTNTTIFLPVDFDCNRVGVRKPISSEEIENIIKSVDLSESILDDNQNRCEEICGEILKSGEHTKLIQLIYELHRKQTQRVAKGKQLRIADSKVLKSAERIINEEFAYALNLELDDAAPYIVEKLGLQSEFEV